MDYTCYYSRIIFVITEIIFRNIVTQLLHKYIKHYKMNLINIYIIIATNKIKINVVTRTKISFTHSLFRSLQ